jgi:hypothetical protein
MQLLAPTRHAHLLDASVKAGGVVIGACAAVLVARIRAKWPMTADRQAQESIR